MKKKVVLLALLLIVVATGAVWVVKAAFMPSASAEAVARDFLIQYYSIPSHDFYTQRLQPSPQDAIQAITEKFGRFLTDSYLNDFLANRNGDRLEAWAANSSYLLAINKMDVQPTSSEAKGATTYLQYDITLTVTRESDKRLATLKQSGRINVDKVNGGYRVSAWQIDNEKKLYQENLFP